MRFPLPNQRILQLLYIAQLLALGCLLCCGRAAGADERPGNSIDLREGDHLRGSCEGVQGGKVAWRSAYGDVLRFPVAEVRALAVDNLWDLELSDGQTLRGSWRVADGYLSVHSKIFGELRCPVELLVSALPYVSGKGLADPPAPAGVDSPPLNTGAGAAVSAPTSTPTDNQAPPSSLQSLLRASSVLLRPGEWNVASSLLYQYSHTLYSPTDTHELSTDLQIQRGITPRFELALAWAARWTHTSTLVFPTTSSGSVTQASSDIVRSDNPEISGSTMLVSEGIIHPEVVLVSGLTIPVNSVANDALFQTRLGLEFLKTSDPGAVFAGIEWMRELNGWGESPYKLRNLVSYHLGTAIGLNDELALGLQAEGEYLPSLVDRRGDLISASAEPVSGRFWMNYRLTRHSFVELSFLAPFNVDANATSFKFTYILRY
ncbi:MAG TPA: hypothetical protein VGM64_09500 [Lacunisphaera sp.]